MENCYKRCEKMIREWWNKKTAEEKWKTKAGVAWFGGAFAILIIIFEFVFMPKIKVFLDQASPTELAEVDAYLNNQIMWMIGIILVTIIISIVVNCYCGKDSKDVKK